MPPQEFTIAIDGTGAEWVLSRGDTEEVVMWLREHSTDHNVAADTVHGQLIGTDVWWRKKPPTVDRGPIDAILWLLRADKITFLQARAALRALWDGQGVPSNIPWNEITWNNDG